MNAAGFGWIFSLIVKHLRELGVKLVTKNDSYKACASELSAVNMSEYTRLPISGK